MSSSYAVCVEVTPLSSIRLFIPLIKHTNSREDEGKEVGRRRKGRIRTEPYTTTYY